MSNEGLEFKNIFDEIDDANEESINQQALKLYESQAQLAWDNYQFCEKNKQFIKDIQNQSLNFLQKINTRLDIMDKNFQQFERDYKDQKFLSKTFNKLNITDLCKLPPDGNTKLPQWFEGYKEEELEKLRIQLDQYGCRIYTNSMNDRMKSDRKLLCNKIRNLIKELEQQEQSEQSFSVSKITELQQALLELQQIEKIIPEVCVLIQQKAQDCGKVILWQFIDFKEKCNGVLYQQF